MLKQFFTHDYQPLIPFVETYAPAADVVVDPFAGQGHLLRLFQGRVEIGVQNGPGAGENRR